MTLHQRVVSGVVRSLLTVTIPSVAFALACGGGDRPRIGEESNPPGPEEDLPPTRGPGADTPIAFVGVEVIPLTDGSASLPDRTVLVRDGRIAAIGPRAELEVPEGALTIDGTDRFLIPGLADMHVHLEHFDDPAVLALFVAHGVTTVRNLDGRPYILQWRERAERGELVAPTIYTAGPILDGDPPLRDDNTVVRSADEARAVVRAQVEAGYDFVKVYTNLSGEAYRAVLEEAEAAGVPVAGHVPRELGLVDALEAGQRVIEHLDGFDELIEADDSPYREGWHWSKLYLAMPADSAKIANAAEIAAQGGAWHVPTLVQAAKGTAVDSFGVWLESSETAYLPAEVRAWWDPESWDPASRALVESYDAETEAVLERGRRNREAMVRALYGAGVGIAVGTDTPNPFVVPGLAVHEELENLVAAGLPPAVALAAATRDAARVPGAAGEYGRIEVGGRADLLLLGADPRVEIGNTRAIEGVMVRGRWFPPAELDRLRGEVVEAFAGG